MPVYECQACEYLTNNSFVAKIHNEKDKNHYFKKIGEDTILDVKISRKLNEINKPLPSDLQKQYEEEQYKLIQKYRR